MKKQFLLFFMLIAFASAGAFAQNQSIVYFTRDVSSAGLMKVYRALNQKIEGSVGIKVSFGGPDEEVLQPELLRELVSPDNGDNYFVLFENADAALYSAKNMGRNRYVFR